MQLHTTGNFSFIYPRDTKQRPENLLIDVAVEAAEVEGGSWFWKRASATSSTGAPITDTGCSDAVQTQCYCELTNLWTFGTHSAFSILGQYNWTM